MVDRLYTLEKLGAAVQTLATHPGRVKERLDAAFSAGLAQVDPNALSGDARRMWDATYTKLTAREDRVRGAVAASLDLVDEEEACRLAQAIVSVDAMLDHELHGG